MQKEDMHVQDSQREVLHKAAHIREHVVHLEPAAWPLVAARDAHALVGVQLAVCLRHHLPVTTAAAAAPATTQSGLRGCGMPAAATRSCCRFHTRGCVEQSQQVTPKRPCCGCCQTVRHARQQAGVADSAGLESHLLHYTHCNPLNDAQPWPSKIP